MSYSGRVNNLKHPQNLPINYIINSIEADVSHISIKEARELESMEISYKYLLIALSVLDLAEQLNKRSNIVR